MQKTSTKSVLTLVIAVTALFILSIPSYAQNLTLTGTWILTEQNQGLVLLATSHSDGTMTVAQPTMDTSESHGTWESTGIDEYATTDRAFIYDTQTGIASAIRKMRSKITLDPGGETLSGTVIIDYLALDGSPVQTLETTVVGQRLHVEPIE